MTDPIGAAVTAERLALCDVLDTLGTDDWATPSLCGEWTVRDVVAHLTLTTRETLWDMVRGVVRARGSFDRMNTEAARTRARSYEPAELVDQLRETAGSSRRSPMSSPLDPLLDVLVHGQDIVRPLGLDHPTDPDHAKPALDHAVGSRWYGGPKRFAGLTLSATDSDWTHGDGGDDVRGASGDLLLVTTGRPAGLDGLSGTGVASLAERLGR